MTFKDFVNLSYEEKQIFINKLKHDMTVTNLRMSIIAEKNNCKIQTIRDICKLYNIKKTKEQIIENRKEAISLKTPEEKEKIKEKRKQTNLKKYGVENPYQSEIIKNKIKQTCKEKYGNEIPSKTDEIKNKIKQSNIEKYGVDHPWKSKEIQEKIKQSNLEKYGNVCTLHGINQHKIEEIFFNKYGVNNPFKSNIIKEKTKQTKLERYGDECYNNREKAKETCIEKYGSETFSSSVEGKQHLKNIWNNKSDDEKATLINKAKQTKLEKYGDSGYHNINKMKRTNLEKYGVEFTFQSKDIQNKIKKTCKNKYGVEHIINSQQFKIKREETKLKKYGDKNYSNRKKAKQTCKEKYGNENYSNMEQTVKTNLEKYGVPYYCMTLACRIAASTTSKINQRFAKLLEENNIEFKQEFNIKNKSYDFKVENTLIEINPTYTHNSTIGAIFMNSTSKKEPLSKMYHLEKSQLAKETGFRCIHIWDWDNWDKIINLLLPKQKIYARNCELKEVSKKECDEFLNMYHLQNTCNGQKIRYGLYYNNELVQVMTFGKPRYNKNYEYELLRLCSHKDYIIIGGSQKLFKYFLKTQTPRNIISYCDNSKFLGDVYEALGMIKISNGFPAINWSKGIERITNNLLNQRGYDQLFKTNFGKWTSNRDLMIENGWREVYDCGQSVYEWKNAINNE